MISPDGNWWWNGREWRPIRELPVGRTRSAWRTPCVVVAVLALVIAGVGTCATVSSVMNAASRSAQDTACTPKPCANADGFVVFVDKAEWRITPPFGYRLEPGNQLARVTVRFANHATTEKHADPFQFVLQDQQGVKHALTFAGDGWQAVNLAPGASFGPRTLDYQVSAGTTSGALVWTPDLRDRQMPL